MNRHSSSALPPYQDYYLASEVDAELARRDDRIAELEAETKSLIKRANFTKWWHGVRLEQIWHMLKEQTNGQLFERVCEIMANGSPMALEKRRAAVPTEEMLTELEIETDYLRKQLSVCDERERELMARVLYAHQAFYSDCVDDNDDEYDRLVTDRWNTYYCIKGRSLLCHYAALIRANKPGWWNPTNRCEK